MPILLTMRDLDRLKVIRDVLEGRLRQHQAAEQLDISDRQVRRLCRKVQNKGPAGLAHGLRGRKSNRQLDASLLDRAASVGAGAFPLRWRSRDDGDRAPAGARSFQLRLQ